MWVARNKNGLIGLFIKKPHRHICNWFENLFAFQKSHWRGHGFIGYLYTKAFQNVHWEDEPIEVELMSKKSLMDLKVEIYDYGYNVASKKPKQVLSKDELMEIIKECSVQLSDDFRGRYYVISDLDKLVDMICKSENKTVEEEKKDVISDTIANIVSNIVANSQNIK